MKIYVASSWRNPYQPSVVERLEAEGFGVYDFRRDGGFGWHQIDSKWLSWTVREYREKLNHPLAVEGFSNDHNAMLTCDACVLVMPAGRSASIETGWFWGQGKPFWLLALEPMEPDLMFRRAVKICDSLDELVLSLKVDRR